MAMGDRRMMNGDKAWIVLYIGVAAYDHVAYKREWTTMSAATLIHLRSPAGKIAFAVGWTYLTGHLTGVIPGPYDPLRRWGMRTEYRDLPPRYAKRPPGQQPRGLSQRD